MTTSWGKSSGKAFAKVLIFGHFLTWGFCWKLWKQLQANLCLGFVSTSIKNIQLFGSNERKDASKLELETAFGKNNCVKLRFSSFFFALTFPFSLTYLYLSHLLSYLFNFLSLSLSCSCVHTHTHLFVSLTNLLFPSLSQLFTYLSQLPSTLSFTYLQCLFHTFLLLTISHTYVYF